LTQRKAEREKFSALALRIIVVKPKTHHEK
jgi:hypothetical protein